MVHSIESLLDGLFGSVKPEGVAADYDDAVAQSGAAVVLDVDDEAEATRAEALLRACGALAVSLVPPTAGSPLPGPAGGERAA